MTTTTNSVKDPTLIYVNFSDLSATKGNSINERGFVEKFLEIDGFKAIFIGCTPEGKVPFLQMHQNNLRLHPLNKSGRSQIRFQYWLYQELMAIIKEAEGNCVLCCRPHYFSFATILVKWRTNVPLISKEAGLGVELFRNHQKMGLLKRQVATFLRAKHGQVADNVWCVTEPIRQYWIKRMGVPEVNTFVLGNGTDVSRFTPDVLPDLPMQLRPLVRWEWTALYAGHLNQQVQGLDCLIQTIALLVGEGYNIGLIVAGDGVQRDSLEDYAKKLGISSNICFAGWLPYDSMPGLFAYCDILTALLGKKFLREHGSSSQKVFQSVAIGRPLIAGKADDHKFIEVNNFGVLVDPEDPVEISQAFRKIINAGKKNRNPQGYEYVMENCSYKNIAAAIAARSRILLSSSKSVSSEKCR